MTYIHQIILVLSLILGISHAEAKTDPVPTEQVALTPHLGHSEGYIFDATTTVLFNMTNAVRKTHLNENQQLMKAAWYRAKYFCNHPLEHYSSDGVNPWSFFALGEYDSKDAGENLAQGYSRPQEMQLAFMNSPEHYANIINPKYTDIGLAEMCGKVVVLFGDK